MKKGFKNLLAVALSLTLVATVFTSCGGNGSGAGKGDEFTGNNGVVDNIDGKDKTKITMYVYQGGEGTDWAYSAAELFAETNVDTPFADGKKGVYIDITPGPTNTNLYGTIASEGYNLYYTSVVVSNFAASNLLLDITDVVTDTSREGGSIESIIYEGVADSMKSGGRWYALPAGEYYPGLHYNKKVFDNQLLYIAGDSVEIGDADTQATEYSSDYGTVKLVNSLSTVKSAGSDGEMGTEDDGMPRSLEEMLVLMAYIRDETDYSPITLAGMYTNYGNYLMEGLWASLAGYDQMRNYYNCNGEIEVVTGYYDEPILPGIDYIKKPKVEKVTLTDKTGYLGNDMAAKYYAFAMMEIIEREGFYSSPASYSNTVDHYGAQKYLIYDGLGKYSNSKSAMLIEGSYWYNETVDGGVLEDYRKAGGDAANVSCRFMPLPTAYEQKDFVAGKKSTLLDGCSGQIIINGNIKGNTELEKAAKAFMAFLYTDEQNRAYTSYTGMARAMEYSLSPEEISKMPSYYQSLWKMREPSGTNVVYLSGKGQYEGTFAKVYDSIKIRLNSTSNVPFDGVANYFREDDDKKDDTSSDIVEYKNGTKTIFDTYKISEGFWKSLNIG